ncbi:MAG: NAD(P)-dependent oxidoreductase [Eubacteriales bacterium]|nr:NAD(P)-dependent oxidoreductase [Eubacteriales bacterium]
MGLHIENEADRCLNCKKPMCQQYCPVQTPIPHIIRLFKENRLQAAGAELFENNPLSVVCATVCNHEMQCAGHCVLGKKGSPVQFYDIEKFISDSYLDRMEIPEIPKKNKTAAVIGSGPAGMTAAIILAKHGYGVTIFEEKDKIGGMLQYGIPEFRLPKTILTRYKTKLLEMGVQIRPNTVMGGALNIENLFRDGYNTVFVGTGVWRPKTLGIEGECLANVHFGISYLANPSAYDLGETVAVIGMGNVAMDVARTAFRNGAQRVLLFARGKRATASSHEMAYARLDGAEFIFGKAIEKITPEGPVFKISVFDENDKIIGYEEKRELVLADSIIIAVSQGPKNKLVMTTHNLECSERGLLITDENCMTTRPGVFAAGDVVHGAKTVVHAVEEAKKAANAMIAYMEK